MSRIAAAFARLKAQHRKALIPFFTAGDPDPSSTVPLMHAMVRSGADVIELGVPFSDPMADGPTIQRSSERALKFNVGLRMVLEMVLEFRRTDSVTPVVLMGYANPVERMGYERFAEAAASSGVDGVLVVDYPPEESAALVEQLVRREIDPIFLLAPTSSPQRIEQVTALGRGYLYYVALKGVTGASNIDLGEIAQRIPHIRAKAGLPVGVGFGIRDGETARAVAAIADAVIIGSRIVEEIEGAPRDQLLVRVSTLLQGIRLAIDGAPA